MIGGQASGRISSAQTLGLLWMIGLSILALRPLEDYDTFWQLQSGRHIWQTKAFLYKDTFSLAAEAFRLEHCWLHDVILYGLYTLGGHGLLSLIKPAVIAACGALLYRWNLQRGAEPAIALPVLLLCLLGSEPSWAERPQLWTFLFALLYLHLLHRGREAGGRAWLWLAPIMLLWVNLHAGAIFGLVLIGLFGAAELLRVLLGRATWGGLGRLAGAGLLTFAAAFFNPYGYRIPLGQLLAHMNQYKVAVGIADTMMLGNMEWLPPTFAQVPLFYVVMALWGGLILWRLRRLDPAEGIFFLAFAYMGFGQIRHTTLVSLLAGYYLPLAFEQVIQPLWRKWLPRLPLAALGRWGAMAALAVLIAQQAAAGALGWGIKANEFPTAAADFILEQHLPPQLYNAYDWGGYLMWRLYPDYLVFVDGRQDSPEHFRAANRIDNLRAGWEADLDRYGVNTVVTRTCYYDTGGPIPLVEGLTRNPGWTLVFRDETALVFIRREEPFRPLWERYALPPQAAFETMLAEAQRLYGEDSDRTRVRLALGRASLHLGSFKEAAEHYRRQLKRYPGDQEATQMLNLIQRRDLAP